MEKINSAAEAFTKSKVNKLEERIEEHIKLFNSNVDIDNQNRKYLSDKINASHKYAQEIEKELCELREQVKQLSQQKERFQHNLMYSEIVEDIISTKETEWENKTFNNMLVKLVGKDEIYKIFVQTSNAPVIGSKIKFTFNADENKLSQIKKL